MRAFLGADLGTSGLKLTLVDEAGGVRGETAAGYDVSAPRPGWAEMEPPVWWAAWDAARAELDPALADVELAGISVTGQMHGVVLVDEGGTPVRPAVLWPDLRAEEVLDVWSGLPVDVLDRVGTVATGMAGPSLTWLSRHEPESLQRAATVLSPKDWLRSRLTGDRVTERSDASATALWDVVADDWSPPAVTIAGVDRAQLPEVRGCAEVVGTCQGVPVAAGGSDVACALVGVAAAAPVTSRPALVVNVGSGVQVARPGARAQPRREAATHLFADTGGGWYEMVGVRNGGLSLAWVQRVLRLRWSELVAVAAAADPGCGGVLFLPFLTGERGHVAPVEPRAGWSGVGSSTGAPELARAAFEALGFTIRRAVELLAGDGEPVLLCGGGAREPFVRRLIGDCLGVPVTYLRLRSASAVGAAALAARAVGHELRLPVETVEVEPRPGGGVAEHYAGWREAVKGDGPLTTHPAGSARRISRHLSPHDN